MIFARRFKVALALSLAAGASLALSAQQPAARIKIDTERVIGQVDPLMFGNFTEHLGRCIYGGIFEEGSPLSDADGYRKDVMEATRGLGVTMLRWPGGNFASGYNWKDGIGPRNMHPPRRDNAWGAPAPQERPGKALGRQVLGTGQRNRRAVATGPQERRGLRQVRAGGRQGHAARR